MSQFLAGKKTVIGVLVVLIPVIAGFFGYDVSESFPVQFALYAEETFAIVGGALALYGRAVAETPMWLIKKK